MHDPDSTLLATAPPPAAALPTPLMHAATHRSRAPPSNRSPSLQHPLGASEQYWDAQAVPLWLQRHRPSQSLAAHVPTILSQLSKARYNQPQPHNAPAAIIAQQALRAHHGNAAAPSPRRTAVDGPLAAPLRHGPLTARPWCSPPGLSPACCAARRARRCNTVRSPHRRGVVPLVCLQHAARPAEPPVVELRSDRMCRPASRQHRQHMQSAPTRANLHRTWRVGARSLPWLADELCF